MYIKNCFALCVALLFSGCFACSQQNLEDDSSKPPKEKTVFEKKAERAIDKTTDKTINKAEYAIDKKIDKALKNIF